MNINQLEWRGPSDGEKWARFKMLRLPKPPTAVGEQPRTTAVVCYSAVLPDYSLGAVLKPAHQPADRKTDDQACANHNDPA